MSAIINSIIARKDGKPSAYVETPANGATSGHTSTQPGLRGHSVGATYPYGVAGYGDQWAVTKHGAPLVSDVADGSGLTTGQFRELYRNATIAHRMAEELANDPGRWLENRPYPVTWAHYANLS